MIIIRIDLEFRIEGEDLVYDHRLIWTLRTHQSQRWSGLRRMAAQGGPKDSASAHQIGFAVAVQIAHRQEFAGGSVERGGISKLPVGGRGENGDAVILAAGHDQ